MSRHGYTGDCVRRHALLDAASDVCPWCAGHNDPTSPDHHEVHGPNEAGNYYHMIGDDRSALCRASNIHSRIRFEMTTQESK